MGVKKEGKRSEQFKISITNDASRKLKRLSISCDRPVETLASLFITFCLDTPTAVNYVKKFFRHFVDTGPRGSGGKRCCRSNVSLSKSNLERLEFTANKFGCRPGTLASVLVMMCVDSPDVISVFQDKYTKYDEFRVIPFNDNGKIIY